MGISCTCSDYMHNKTDTVNYYWTEAANQNNALIKLAKYCLEECIDCDLI